MIPHPPDIGTVDKRWEPFARRAVGCKLDAQTNQFHTRLLTFEDVGPRKFDDHGPEDLLRLGGPSDVTTIGEDNYKWDFLDHHFGLQVLNAAGFINGQMPAGVYNPKGDLYALHTDDPRHPVFRREMWIGLTDDDWRLLEPPLHFVSAILDDPNVLTFFAAYFANSHVVYADHLRRHIRTAAIPAYLTPGQIFGLYERLIQARQHMTFMFESQTNMTLFAANTAGVRHNSIGTTWSYPRYDENPKEELSQH